MTELETLKDIVEKRETLHKECFECCEDYEPIRQEAIKWVEHYKDIKFRTHSQMEAFEAHQKITWIKSFFNITEEDLK